MHRFLTVFLFIITGMGVTMANTKVDYFVQFNIHNMDCIVRHNGVLLYSTTGLDLPPKKLTFGHSIAPSTAEDKNVLEIMAGNSSKWLKDDPAEFVDGQCEVKIFASVMNPETEEMERKEISSLKATYDENRELTFNDTKVYASPSLTEMPMITAMPDDINKSGNTKVKRLKGERIFMVNHPTVFRWNKATPFQDTPENRQKLWQKYNELRTALQTQDLRKIRAHLEPGVTDSSNFENDRDHFRTQASMAFADVFGLKKEYWLPVKMEDYDLEIHADGRLFQFVEKGTTQASPISYLNRRAKEASINPIFTYINGEIGVAWF